MKDGYAPEIAPLFGARARIIITDGASVDEFW
jgi:hypothetical protein